jgi:hypothetical protein
MNRIRTVLAGLAVAAVLASCSSEVDGAPAVEGTPAPTAPTATAVPTSPPPGVGSEADRAEIEAVFQGYYEALLARDFTTACALNAPETTEALLADLASQGVQVGSCEEAFETIYATPGAPEVADGIAATAQIQDVRVDGDVATISWSAEVEGQRPTVTNDLRRIDGQWRLLDTSSATAN